MENEKRAENKPWLKKKPKGPTIDEFSLLTWIMENKIKTEKGDDIEFKDRLFLIDILNDWSQFIVIKKAAQIGGSVSFNIKALFAVFKMGWNVLYTFPTDTDVNEFVATKTNKIIQMNPHVFGGMRHDNIERKSLGDRNLFYKGTVSKTAAIMTTADLLIHDEASRSDQMVMETMKSRLKASKIKARWMFSNPTTEKDAIDIAWKKSDQKEWMIRCTGCKEEQFLTWPENINKEKQQFVCKKCGKQITDDQRRKGYWKPQRPGKEISGYHISLMMAPWISAKEIIQDSEGDQEYFYNFVLGEPYSPGDIRVSRATILDNWTPKNLETGHYYLGVDVGNIKHYVLGSENGVIKVGRFTKWHELDDLMKKYKPHLVIDAMPDNTMSKYYVETHRNALMSYFNENKSNPKTIVWWGEGDRKGVVYSNRNRIIDQLIDEILRANILFGMNTDQELKLYLRHWESLRRTKVVDNKGVESYEWESTNGEDHYVFATLYYYLAKMGSSNAVYLPDGLKGLQKEIVVNDATPIEDLGNILAQANGWPQD